MKKPTELLNGKTDATTKTTNAKPKGSSGANTGGNTATSGDNLKPDTTAGAADNTDGPIVAGGGAASTILAKAAKEMATMTSKHPDDTIPKEDYCGVILYYVPSDKSAGHVSVFQPSFGDADGYDEMYQEALDLGMVKECNTPHSIKVVIEDKELEKRALTLFSGEVAARKALALRRHGGR